MEINVKSKYLKVSPYKVRPSLYGLRGKRVDQAIDLIGFAKKKGAKFALTLIKSAEAIIKENNLESDKFIIDKIACNEGPRLKRRQIKARGRATQIQKRMCHLYLTISDAKLSSKEVVREESALTKVTKTKQTKDKSQTAKSNINNIKV